MAGQSRRRQSNWLLLCGLFVLATLGASGCERLVQNRNVGPPAELRQFVENHFDTLRRGDSVSAIDDFTPGAASKASGHLVQFAELIASEDPVAVDFGQFIISDDAGVPAYQLSCLLSANGNNFLFILTIVQGEAGWKIDGVNAQAVPFGISDIQEANRFTLSGRPTPALAGLLAAIVFTVFVIWSLLDCARNVSGLQWIWLPVIAFCYPTLLVNWVSGQWSPSPREMVLLFPGLTVGSDLDPVVIHVGLPLGALAWWLYRSRRQLIEPPDDTSSACDPDSSPPEQESTERPASEGS